MSAEERFDPRAHSTVLLQYNEKLPGVSLLKKTAELPVKTFAVGPHVRGTGATARPSSAPASRPSSTAAASHVKHPDPRAPRFLDKDGRWVEEELPEQPQPTPTQALTASVTMTAEVANSMMPAKRGYVRPVSAVYSYMDISPVVTAEHVREAGGHATMTYTLGNRKGDTQQPTSPRSILDGPGGGSPRSPTGQQSRQGDYPYSQGYLTGGGQTSRPSSAPRTSAAGSPKSIRPASAPRAATASSKVPPSGALLINMLTQGPQQVNVKFGTVRQSSRTGKVPANTGHWTNLEPQAPTALRAGQLGKPLDHPFEIGNSANPAAYFGGQYTVKGVSMKPAPRSQSGKQSTKTTGPAEGMLVEQYASTTNGGTVGTNGPYASAASNAFWPAPSPNSLSAGDLKRVEDLGRGAVAGAANCRLVGGQWKLIPRPTEGDVVYTDYYGRYGPEQSNYYGRSYHIQAAEFAKHRLVNDSAYQKVQASMMGIQTLRDRPGLSMETTLVHGKPEQLASINQVNAGKKMGTLHHIGAYHNLQPDQPTWAV